MVEPVIHCELLDRHSLMFEKAENIWKNRAQSVKCQVSRRTNGKVGHMLYANWGKQNKRRKRVASGGYNPKHPGRVCLVRMEPCTVATRRESLFTFLS